MKDFVDRNLCAPESASWKDTFYFIVRNFTEKNF